MSNFRVLILVLLVLALAVLGMLYVNISGKMDLIQMQQQMAAMNAGHQQPNQNSYLPVPTQVGVQTEVQPTIVADPVMTEELSHAKAELERMKRENEELRRANAVAEEERALMERHSGEKNDPRLQLMNDISSAEIVGRVSEYYRDNNLVIFEVLGTPNLQVGQEVCIRRGSGIFASLKIDGMQSGIGEAYMMRNAMLEKNTSESIKPGDEIILPPDSMSDPDATEIATPASDTDLGAPAGTSSDPGPLVVPLEL